MASVGALASLAIIAVFLIFPGKVRRKPHVDVASSSVAAPSAPVGLSEVQSNLAQTVQQMEASYKARAASLDPSAKLTYEKGLSSLDSSIHECLVSLHDQPQNSLAREYLMQAYVSKAEILASAMEYDSH
jgi:hypothetical protein